MRKIIDIVEELADLIPDYGANSAEYDKLLDEIVNPITNLEKWLESQKSKKIKDEYDMGYAQAYIDINRLLENIKTNDRHNVVDNSSDAIDIFVCNGERK